MDKNFKFRLQKILEIREEEEEELKLKLGKVQVEVNRISNKIDDMKKEYKNYSFKKLDMDLISQKITKNYLYALEQSIDSEKKILKLRNEDLNETKEELKAKMIEKKSIEILKEKKYNDFLKVENIKEQIANDEFAMISYIRNKSIAKV